MKTRRTMRRKLYAGMTIACTTLLTGSLLVGGQGAADASELQTEPAFETVFSAYEMPEDELVLPKAERLQAEALSAAAPREIEPEPEADGDRIGGGVASYYGKRFAGRPTASGEIFNPVKLTAAHRTLPFGSKVKVTNKRNGRSVVVRINDRGPFSKGRVIDLSRKAAEEIGLIRAGHAPVELSLL